MAVPIFLRPLARYADFQGRSRRLEFWTWQLCVLLVIGGLEAFAFYPMIGLFRDLASGKAPANPMPYIGQMFIIVPVLVILSFGIIIPNLAVQVRRLHDVNLTGWLILAPTVVQMLGQSLMYIFDGDSLMRAQQNMMVQMQQMHEAAFGFQQILMLEWQMFKVMIPWIVAPSLLCGLVLLTIFCWPGTRGANKFGPDPKQKTA